MTDQFVDPLPPAKTPAAAASVAEPAGPAAAPAVPAAAALSQTDSAAESPASLLGDATVASLCVLPVGTFFFGRSPAGVLALGLLCAGAGSLAFSAKGRTVLVNLMAAEAGLLVAFVGILFAVLFSWPKLMGMGSNDPQARAAIFGGWFLAALFCGWLSFRLLKGYLRWAMAQTGAVALVLWAFRLGILGLIVVFMVVTS